MKDTSLPKRAVLYIRVATKEQPDDTAQKKQSAQLHEQAERDGLSVVGEVKVHESGMRLNRPGWREALRLAAEKQADVILVRSFDRVTRDYSLFEQVLSDMEKRGIRLHTCDGNMDEMYAYRNIFRDILKHYSKVQ